MGLARPVWLRGLRVLVDQVVHDGAPLDRVAAEAREDRDALIAAEPDLFFLPEPSDLRFNWVCCQLARLDPDYMTELVPEAWRTRRPR